MMTYAQKILLYAIGGIASALFTWPLSLLLIFFFADMDGKFPVRKHAG